MPLATVDRRARAATTLIFFLTGFVYAAWATRIPVIKADLGLSAGALGVAVLGLEAGAIAGLPAGAALTARAGSRTALRVGFAAYPAALVGSAAAAAGVSVTAHFGAVAALGLTAGTAATFGLVRDAGPRDGRRTFSRPSGRLLGLGLIAFCAFLLDGAANNWSAVHLSSEHGAGAGLAAGAFTLLSLTLAIGRLFGDRLVERLGRVRLVQGCGAVAAAGSALAISAPAPGAALGGWALFGLGLAALAPTVLGAAPAAGSGSPAAAIAAVTTVGYLGSFSGPPLVGALAEAGSLPAALGLLVVVSGAMVLLAPRVQG